MKCTPRSTSRIKYIPAAARPTRRFSRWHRKYKGQRNTNRLLIRGCFANHLHARRRCIPRHNRLASIVYVMLRMPILDKVTNFIIF